MDIIKPGTESPPERDRSWYPTVPGPKHPDMEPDRDLTPADGRLYYPVYEEHSVPQVPEHTHQFIYLVSAVRSQQCDRFVTGDYCLFWNPKDNRRYVAPDVVVAEGPPLEDPPRVHLFWQDPPVLFVGELGSRKSIRDDTHAKPELYEGALGVPEYLYSYPSRGDLRLWRNEGGSYRLVAPDEDGRVWSVQTGLGFGIDEARFLRVYDATGQMIPTYAEAEARAEDEARRRAEAADEVARLRAEVEPLRGADKA